MKRALTLLFCLFMLNSYAQHRKFTFAGIELGAKFDTYTINDSGNQLFSNPSMYKPLIGLQVQQELSERILIGTGLYFNTYGKSFGFKSFPTTANTTQAISTLQIPLRAYFKIPIKYGVPEINFGFVGGVHLVINNSYDRTAETMSGIIPPSLNDQYSGVANYHLMKAYPLIEGGAWIEFMLANSTTFSLNSSYYKGMSDVINLAVDYRYQNKNQKGNIVSKGDFFTFNLAVKYPISRLWVKHKLSK